MGELVVYARYRDGQNPQRLLFLRSRGAIMIESNRSDKLLSQHSLSSEVFLGRSVPLSPYVSR